MSVHASTAAAVPISMGSARQAVMAGSILAFLGAISIFTWSFLNWDDSPRQVITGGGGILGCALATVGGVLLVLALPRILEGLAPWAILATAAGLVFVVVDAWFNGTVAVGVAKNIDDATYDTIYQSGWAFTFSLPKMLLCLTGFTGLAISGWRSGLISRPLAILLIVAGIASLVPPFMPGMLLASIAFFLLARAHASR